LLCSLDVLTLPFVDLEVKQLSQLYGILIFYWLEMPLPHGVCYAKK
jgi:hypothetical protein